MGSRIGSLDFLQRTRIDPDEMTRKVSHAVALEVEQCLRFGVTSIGDISRQCATTRPLLNRSALRVVSYGEIQAMAQRRVLLEERLQTALDDQWASDRLRVGLTPHAPYSVEVPIYQRCLAIARERGLPLATHLAETPDERAFLMEHSGPFRGLWDAWLTWDDQVPTYPAGPIEMATAIGLLDYPTLLAHVNYANDDELDLLSRGRASVVYCPRTHAYFGHPPHRFREMLARGINVAVGTDSCASSPNLNLVNDLRLIHRLYPDLPAETLWEMATINGARAIGISDEVGSLTVGKRADFIIFPVSSDQPLREILENPSLLPNGVWINGQAIGC
jgi:aminodeoxyfutalosine deaminase